MRAGGLGALATVLLLLKWTLLMPDLYESQAVVEMTHSTSELGSEAASRRGLLALSATLAASQAHEKGSVKLQGLELDSRHFAFVCRAPSAHVAHQRCGELVTRALSAKLARGVSRPATLPSRPLPFEHGWGIWLLSCAVGFGAALLWVAGAKLWFARRAPQPATGGATWPPRVSIPPRSSIPPAAGRASATSVSGTAAKAVTLDSQPAPGAQESGQDAHDHLRALRDQLFLQAADSCLVVGVSSRPEEIDAKAFVAGQLAWTLAESEQVEVLLLEADFDQPSVHLVMDIMMPPLSGFTQQIHARLQGGTNGPWTVVRRTPSLSVLAEGLLRTPGMMYSQRFSAAINELRGAYDIIVVSGPCVGAGVDVRAFADIVDGIVFVTRPDEGQAEANKVAGQTFRNKRFLSLVPAPQLDDS